MARRRRRDSTIRNIFRNSSYNRCYRRDFNEPVPMDCMYMEIPLSGNVFEVPAMAFKTFADAADRENMPDAIAVVLCDNNHTSGYVSLDKVMQVVLEEEYGYERLVKLDITRLDKTYYGTFGAIFDENFHPVLMCSWVVQKGSPDDPRGVAYELIQPIVRIEPCCFLNQNDAVKGFISKKFISESLNNTVLCPSVIPPGDSQLTFDISVKIERNPFSMRRTEAPSVSTTNEELLQTALNYIDEVAA